MKRMKKDTLRKACRDGRYEVVSGDLDLSRYVEVRNGYNGKRFMVEIIDQK